MIKEQMATVRNLQQFRKTKVKLQMATVRNLQQFRKTKVKLSYEKAGKELLEY